MQGRLQPPVDGRIQAFPADDWESEFVAAREAGVEGIEWIYEVYGEDRNPIGSDAGLERLAKLVDEHGIAVESLCADWLMDCPLLAVDGEERERRRQKLLWLADRAGRAGIRRIVLPFVDASALRGPADVDTLLAILGTVAPDLERAGVELHLETSLGPDEFRSLLERIDHPLIKANYDTGNSASLGFDPREEFAAYGSRIGSVHVKDRLRGGGTVSLGSGAADLPAVFELLASSGWERPLVLQVARGAEGEEPLHVRSAAEYVRELWARSAERAWS